MHNLEPIVVTTKLKGNDDNAEYELQMNFLTVVDNKAKSKCSMARKEGNCMLLSERHISLGLGHSLLKSV